MLCSVRHIRVRARLIQALSIARDAQAVCIAPLDPATTNRAVSLLSALGERTLDNPEIDCYIRFLDRKSNSSFRIQNTAQERLNSAEHKGDMQSQIDVGVIGVAFLMPRHSDRMSLEEALHSVTTAALRDAGVSIEDIDGVVVASCDQLDGRAIAIMAASGSVGGVGRDILSTPSSAEHAFVLGALRVKSGGYRTQLIVSWSPLEVDSVSETQRLGADPYFHRALPLDDLASHALQATAIEARHPGVREDAWEITRSNRAHGLVAYPDLMPFPREKVLIAGGKTLRWPITEGMVSPPSYGAVAIVLASDEWIDQRVGTQPAWVQGMGWATEPGFLGDRDLATLPSLKAAALMAYREAGIDADSPQFDVAEIADATPYQQLLSLEGLGICAAEQWTRALEKGEFVQGGRMPVNLSGGALSFNPVYCSGLMRIAEAANQARGCSGRHQHPAVNKAVAHGASGFAMQYNTVVVLGAERVGAPQ